jgi:hypothetical protein
MLFAILADNRTIFSAVLIVMVSTGIATKLRCTIGVDVTTTIKTLAFIVINIIIVIVRHVDYTLDCL